MRSQDYKQALDGSKVLMSTFKSIVAKRRELVTKDLTRSLKCYDDKRFLLPKTFETFAHGHFRAVG